MIRALAFAACLSLTVAAMTTAQSNPPGAPPAPRQSPDGPRCAYQRQGHPGYIVWICNEAGDTHDRVARILRVRTNAAGVETVTTVWSGRIEEIAKGADAIIAKDEEAHARCSRYFHVAQSGGPGTTWNAATAPMRDWIDTGARREHPQLCYSVEPRAADFVIVWSEQTDGLPFAFTELPDSDSPRQPPYRRGAAPSGESPATPAVSGAPGSDVTLAVYPVESGRDGAVVRLGRSLYVSDERTNAAPAPHSSRPASLVAALHFLAARQ